MPVIITGNPWAQGLSAGGGQAGEFVDWQARQRRAQLEEALLRQRIMRGEHEMDLENQQRSALEELGPELFQGLGSAYGGEPGGPPAYSAQGAPVQSQGSPIGPQAPSPQGPPAPSGLLGSPYSSDDHQALTQMGGDHAQFLRRAGQLWGRLDPQERQMLERDTVRMLSSQERSVRRQAVGKRLETLAASGAFGDPTNPGVQATIEGLRGQAASPDADPEAIWGEIQKAAEPVRRMALQQQRGQEVFAKASTEAQALTQSGVELGNYAKGLLYDLQMGMDPDEFLKQWQYAKRGLEPYTDEGRQEWLLPQDITQRRQELYHKRQLDAQWRESQIQANQARARESNYRASGTPNLVNGILDAIPRVAGAKKAASLEDARGRAPMLLPGDAASKNEPGYQKPAAGGLRLRQDYQGDVADIGPAAPGEVKSAASFEPDHLQMIVDEAVHAVETAKPQDGRAAVTEVLARHGLDGKTLPLEMLNKLKDAFSRARTRQEEADRKEQDTFQRDEQERAAARAGLRQRHNMGSR